MSVDSLSDDQIFRGAVITLRDLRSRDETDPLYGEFWDVAAAWVNEAQTRLSARKLS